MESLLCFPTPVLHSIIIPTTKSNARAGGCPLFRSGLHRDGISFGGTRRGRSIQNRQPITPDAAFNGQNHTSDVPLLTQTQVFERLKDDRQKREGKQLFLAMYSSVFGGITTDPTTMVIPIDDHMVHRGHGVFDTAAIMGGYLYELDQHLDRFLRSASMAKICLPFDRASIRNILIKTVSASKCEEGSLRYWLSAGPGDFQLSPSNRNQSALYAIVTQYLTPFKKECVKVVTSTVPIKPQQFAIMKNVNYLPNVLSKMEAEDKGAFAAIWLDNDGYIAEGPNMNVAFVTQQNELLMPSFDKILSGCTAKRVLSLSEKLVREGKLSGIRVRNVTMEEGKNAREMMLIGSGILVSPVLQWDEQIIGDGKEGPISEALLNLIVQDMKSGPSDSDEGQLFFKFFTSVGEELEEAAKDCSEILKTLEEQGLGEKKFFGGESIGLVDIVFGWMAHWLKIMEEAVGTELVEPQAFPHLHGWMERFKEVDVIKDNLPDYDELLVKAKYRREMIRTNV